MDRKPDRPRRFSVRGPVAVALENALSLFFPPICLYCEAARSPHSRWFCAACVEKLRRNHEARNPCPRCGVNRHFHKCACEIVWDYPFESIYSFYEFDETVQKIMHSIKYDGRSRLAFDLGAAIGANLPPAYWDDVDLVTAVPLHWLKRLKRGYNQSDHVCKGLVSAAKRPIAFNRDVLKRSAYTRTQTKLDRQQRQHNVEKAFAVPQAQRPVVRNARILLVDDVITTGATTAACARVLRDAGCASVKVLSLARD